MPFTSTLVFLLLLLLAAPAIAQPSLSSLWPLEVGRSWEFDVRVEGPFDQIETGTLTQTVVGLGVLPSGRVSACFSADTTVPESSWAIGSESPDSRKITDQPSLLLAVPGCGIDVGVAVDETEALGAWNEATADWEWWWITADLTPGASFQLQIRKSLADDAFVNGELRTLEGAVTTPAGSFTDAAIVDYVVELGESTITDQGGEPIGTVSFEVTGWVAFVPDVGPVASEETFAPAAIDCPTCPPVVFEPISTSLALRSTTPVGSEERSFGSFKARF
jgi:hypothetical protein